MKGFRLLAPLALGICGASIAGTAIAQNTATPAPKRINRAIEVLESGQPVYYTQTSGGGYEDGKRLAATKADYITYDMEHGTFDVGALREFMRGLVDAGKTRTGHRTPAVIVTLPVLGDDPASMKANAWVAQQVMATGVHGILLCQAESPEAVRIFVEAMRYPFAPGADPKQGHRGAGSQVYASKIWGVTPNEYLRKADVWPLNPEGEVMLGIKIENPKATANAEELTKVKGIAFAEWGPGDQAFYLLGLPKTERVVRDANGTPRYVDGSNRHSPEMVATRARVLAATKAAGIRFLNACPEDDVINQLKEGTMICTGGDTPAADAGRAYTKRKTVW
jgi:4-hydroxy-2-oxoheptanedioate aldolase